jgi:hypothetical protein
VSFPSEKHPSGRQFQWPGRVSIFFREDGMYVFGDVNRLRILVYTFTLLLVVFLSGQLIPLLKLPFYEIISILLSEVAIGLGVVTYSIFQKYYSKKARSQFPRDVKLDDLLSSHAKFKFYPWSQLRFAKFDGNILNVAAGPKLMGLRGFMGCTVEQTAELQLFLSEKLGDRYKGSGSLTRL